VKFARVPLSEAEGAIAAHAARYADRTLQKGTVLTPALLADLDAAGVGDVVVARLDADDVPENEAAERVAGLIAGAHLKPVPPVNGRADLVADATGVVVIDRDMVDRVNLAQQAIQLATLPEFATAKGGEIVATIKVVPFAVPAETLAAVEAAVGVAQLRLAPFRAVSVGVVATQTPTLKPSVLDKTRRVFERRLQASGSTVGNEFRIEHDATAIGEALTQLRGADHQLLVVFGASATSDAADVVPAGIEAAGGRVLRIGMPVDPGNLLVLGELDGVPVIGAPGCARSPAASGFDWVLQRLLADLPVSAADIARMGVGGVLAKERYRPFSAVDEARSNRRIDAVILAAGESSRMQGRHKLLARIDGRPLVRIVAEEALASSVASVTVVVGHRAEEVRTALHGLDVNTVENADFRTGLSSSVRTAVSSLPSDSDAVVVLLADMPDIAAAIIDAVVAEFDPESGTQIVVPTFEGRRGNPVLWSRRFFPDLMAIEGDRGARDLLGANADVVAWVETGPAVVNDVDTPDEMAAASGTWA
jgi:molybdenum cofactor cytidylyltransferase